MLLSLAVVVTQVFLFATPGKPAPAAPAPTGSWSAPVEVKGSIDGHSGKGSMLVYLPAGYAKEKKTKKYPLVIALHGWDHSPELFKTKGELAPWADKYGVVVGVPAMGRTVYETRFYPESKGAWTTAPGTRWIGEVILPYLRQHYAVARDRGHTAIIGYSTGGRGAVLVAETYPEFAFIGSLSGTYQLDTLEPKEGEYKIHALVYGPRDTFPDRWRRDNCVSPERLAKLTGTRLYIAHGGKDRVVNPNQVDSLRKALGDGSVQADYVIVPEGAHDWSFWNSQWGPMFQAMNETFLKSSAAAPSSGR